MSQWEPEDYDDNPIANAIYNVAAQIADLSASVNVLLYGLKYSRQEGMSVAEAIEVAADRVAGPLSDLAQSIDNLDPK